MDSKNYDKIEKMVDMMQDHSVQLAELRTIAKQNSEIMHSHEEMLSSLVEDSRRNTNDLEYHILRTDLLEERTDIIKKMLDKLYIIGAGIIGALSVTFGPNLLKYLVNFF